MNAASSGARWEDWHRCGVPEGKQPLHMFLFSYRFLDALASCHSVIGVFDYTSGASDTSNTKNVVTCFFVLAFFFGTQV